MCCFLFWSWLYATAQRMGQHQNRAPTQVQAQLFRCQVQRESSWKHTTRQEQKWGLVLFSGAKGWPMHPAD
uniref:Uncharacterized protein n=1 Tax=Rhizophora mucronata TaxID=61149 RepID=A0A2P2NK55_RHIMU